MIARRRLLIALGLNALAVGTSAPLANAAPPPGKVVRLGLLYAIPEKFDPESRPVDRAIVESLRAQGYEVGRNLVLEFRSGKGDAQRVPEAAAELVRLKVDAIITVGTEAMLAARDATRTIPTIMIGGTDPVGTGVVVSLSRPGGNITGMSTNAAEISAKRVQLLKEAVPKLSRVAVLWNSSSRSMTLQFQQIEIASPSLGVIVQSIRVSGSDDLDKAFAAIAESHPGGLIVLFGPLRGNDLPRIVEFVTSNRLPTVFELGQGVRGGGLMEFGPSFAELARHVGTYVDKIANGANPGDLPVQEPTEFELIINIKAARTMGLTIPPSLLLRADQVIE
jgi:putative ABC transport system substrate-binding protein